MGSSSHLYVIIRSLKSFLLIIAKYVISSFLKISPKCPELGHSRLEGTLILIEQFLREYSEALPKAEITSDFKNEESWMRLHVPLPTLAVSTTSYMSRPVQLIPNVCTLAKWAFAWTKLTTYSWLPTPPSVRKNIFFSKPACRGMPKANYKGLISSFPDILAVKLATSFMAVSKV